MLVSETIFIAVSSNTSVSAYHNNSHKYAVNWWNSNDDTEIYYEIGGMKEEHLKTELTAKLFFYCIMFFIKELIKHISG